MLHNLGLAMVHSHTSGTHILSFLWCEPNLHRSFGRVTDYWTVGSLFSVFAIITVVESAFPNASMLSGKPTRLAVPWVSLSVSLNIIVTSMICFRLLRMQALTREALSPEMSCMYTSIVAMLIESAAPLSILGIGLVVTAAQKSPIMWAFGYVWSIFCVESSHAFIIVSTPVVSLTVPLFSVSLSPHK